MLTEDGKHLYVSYDEYHNLIEKLAIRVHQSGWQFDTILCLARGGMRPGDILSRIFNVPLAIMSTSSYRAEAGTQQGHLDIAHYITTPKGQIAGKVLPVEEFKTDRWRAMDADVEFTGKRIVHSEKLPFNDLYTHLKLNDGELSLEPLRFGVAGGKLDAQIRLNGRITPMEGRARLTARNFKLKQLFPTFEPMKTSFGELNGTPISVGAVTR